MVEEGLHRAAAFASRVVISLEDVGDGTHRLDEAVLLLRRWRSVGRVFIAATVVVRRIVVLVSAMVIAVVRVVMMRIVVVVVFAAVVVLMLLMIRVRLMRTGGGVIRRNGTTHVAGRGGARDFTGGEPFRVLRHGSRSRAVRLRDRTRRSAGSPDTSGRGRR